MLPPTALTRSDAWIVAALCESSRDTSMRLRDVIGHADWLNHAIPEFDELSFGLPRLVAAGLAEVTPDRDSFRVRATADARALQRTVKADSLGGYLNEMSAAVGARPYPEPQAEDRSLGRLPGFSEAMFRAEVAAYRREFRADLGKLAGAFGGIVAVLVAWVVTLVSRRRKT